MLQELERRIGRAIVESSVQIVDCDEEAIRMGLGDRYFNNAYRVEVYWKRKRDGVPMGYRKLISKAILSDLEVGGGELIDYFIERMISDICRLEEAP